MGFTNSINTKSNYRDNSWKIAGANAGLACIKCGRKGIRTAELAELNGLLLCGPCFANQIAIIVAA